MAAPMRPRMGAPSQQMRLFTAFTKKYENILVEKREVGVGLIRLHRPTKMNAFSEGLFRDLNDALGIFDKDPEIGAMVITGADNFFTGGADLTEMAPRTTESSFKTQWLSEWDRVSKYRKPIIAAVNGLCVGGGCELSMMCDMILAGDGAMFGQPEILIGTLPGGGGTQRLTRAIGKSKSMLMCLTGERITAQEAERAGLVAKVFPKADLVEEAVKIGAKIASLSRTAVALCKDAVNYSFETGLEAGVKYERNLFYGSFATADRREGMYAFLEKRKAKFNQGN